MNQFNGIGNLATDVYLKDATGRDGTTQKVASFKVAFNRPGKDAGADFLWVSTWNGSAEACAKYLGKGSEVGIEGSLRTKREEQNDGSFKDYISVNARRITFLRRPNDAPSGVEASTAETDALPISDEDIPF